MSNKLDLKTLGLAELVTEHNRLAELLGEKPVNKFKDKATGIKRIEILRGTEMVAKAAKAKEEKNKEKQAAKDAKKKAPKGKPTKDILGDDDDDKPKKKKGKPAKDILGDDDDDKPKKKAKTPKEPVEKKQRGKNSLEKGKEPTFNHEAFSIQKEPREGTFRAKVLGMLEAENGTTIKQIEKAFEKYWEGKGISPKVDIHLRALEMLRLLRYQNGFGFKEEDGRIYALRAPAKK